MKKVLLGLILLPFYGYSLYMTIPSMVFYFDQVKGVAKIESVDKEKLSFSYYHDDEKKQIKLNSKIPYLKHQKMLKQKSEWDIVYSKTFPQRVSLSKIDNKPTLLMPLLWLAAIFLPLLLWNKINWENPFVMKES